MIGSISGIFEAEKCVALWEDIKRTFFIGIENITVEGGDICINNINRQWKILWSIHNIIADAVTVLGRQNKLLISWKRFVTVIRLCYNG